MSTYCYSKADGSGLVERDFRFGHAPRTIRVDGEKLHKNYVAEATPPPPAQRARAKLWPMQATMSGVLPKQVPETIEHLAKHGVTCEFSKQGEPKWTSQRHQDAYCRAMGMFNKQSVTASPRNK